MARSAGSKLTDRILARHGSRPDLRLWRNETANAWVGSVEGRTVAGGIILRPGARMIQCGLFVKSPDLIGILKPTGRVIALEVKAPGDRLDAGQKNALEVLESFGALVGVVRSVEDVDALLGEPPK